MYEDIINQDRPRSKRPPMDRAARAKIFMPFAALKGYEDALEEKQKCRVEKIERSEESKEELNRKIGELLLMLGDGERPVIEITQFIQDKKASYEEERTLGEYVNKREALRKIDVYSGVIKLEEEEVALGDILKIEIEPEAGKMSCVQTEMKCYSKRVMDVIEYTPGGTKNGKTCNFMEIKG